MPSIEEEIIESVKQEFGSLIKDAAVKRPRRINILADAGSLRSIILFLKKEYGPIILSVLTATDFRTEIEVSFGIWSYERKAHILVKSRISRENPVIDSIVDIIPGSTLYEREAHELVGVTFKGHPNLDRLLLPEDWPENSYPLRKDWKPSEVA
jgi:NADH-quinone oxidoreductase subunit C